MDEQVYNEAVENISLIKGVIDRTRRSFASFSKIFIYWGILFLGYPVMGQIMMANQGKTIELFDQYPFLGFLFFTGTFALIAALIYRNISKKIPLIGLEKQLMIIWILVLIMDIMAQPTISVGIDPSLMIDMTKIKIGLNTFSGLLFSLAIALITTALFTGYKHLRNLGIVYIGISVIYSKFGMQLPDATLVNLILSSFLPFTFLYTGFFLKSQQTRGN